MQLISPSILNSIEDVNEWLNRCATIYQSTEYNERIKIDLSNLKWVSPVGCAALAATFHKLSSRYDIRISIPDNDSADKVIGYLERIDFFKICPIEVKTAFETNCDMDKYYNRHRNNQTNALFELQSVKNYSEVGPLQKSIRDIMKGRLSPNRISDIASIIGELANNSIEHGGTPCYPCVQYYPHKKKVEIAICDFGKGIVKTLKDLVPHNSSHDVVTKAILTKASGVEDEDRGRGLMEVKQRTFDWSRISQFYVRTHDSVYQVFPNKVETIESGKYYFGTYYYIVINMH
ncbi:hypothetical protein [Psychrobacillus sp. NPDC096623]|uniref:hypothetical protein n=1 Tax=Psychrobacillus sp. NPDC096623 TaxID=3364492 RepID=UPI0037F9AE4F